MHIEISSLIYLFGIGQAIVLVILININRPFESFQKKITSALLVCMSLILFYYFLYANGLFEYFRYIDSIGTALWMSLLPLYYLFCLSFYFSRSRFVWKHTVFFIIPFVFLIEEVLDWVGINFYVFQLVNDSLLYLDLWMFYFFVVGYYVSIKCIKLHYQQNNLNKNKPLFWFTNIFFLILVVFSIIYLFVRTFYAAWFELSLVISCEVFILVLVFKMFKLNPLKRLFDGADSNQKSIKKQDLKALVDKLEKVMNEDKPFLKSNMVLDDLSKLSLISTGDLSNIFREYYQSNFYKFINDYRLNYFESMLLNPAYKHYKIFALAQESGFKSKATFYKAFREKHQMTPAEYLKK